MYRAYLEQSDVFVGIYWQRYGWIGPGMTVSGLEDEFRLSARMPRLLYLKRPAPAMEPGLRRMLDEIRAEGGLAYKTFANAGELRELLVNDLATLLTERFEGTGRDGPGFIVPAPVTALVGRDRDVDEVVRLLDAQDHRLVVLTGTGGIGKTRLALAVLERSRAHWRDGVAFVDLSSVTDPRLVPQAIVSALGFVVQGRERPIDTLGRRLADRHMLIVLDNFEQVLDAAPEVADLLQRAPQLHVLVTSRAVLRVRGAHDEDCRSMAERLAHEQTALRRIATLVARGAETQTPAATQALVSPRAIVRPTDCHSVAKARTRLRSCPGHDPPLR